MLESAFWGEPDIERLGRPAKSVENDPLRHIASRPDLGHKRGIAEVDGLQRTMLVTQGRRLGFAHDRQPINNFGVLI